LGGDEVNQEKYQKFDGMVLQKSKARLEGLVVVKAKMNKEKFEKIQKEKERIGGEKRQLALEEAETKERVDNIKRRLEKGRA
jgi:hypothetical protein